MSPFLSFLFYFQIYLLLTSCQESANNPVTSSPFLPTSTNEFKCPEKFGYFADTKDCSRYFVCVFGGALHETCTGGLYFSAELQTCDWPRNVLCLQGSSSSVNHDTESIIDDLMSNDNHNQGINNNRHQDHVKTRDPGLSSLSVFDEVDDSGLDDSRHPDKSSLSKSSIFSKSSSPSSESGSKSSREDYDLIADKFNARNNHSSAAPLSSSNLGSLSSLSLSQKDSHQENGNRHDLTLDVLMNDSRYHDHGNNHHYQGNKRNQSRTTLNMRVSHGHHHHHPSTRVAGVRNRHFGRHALRGNQYEDKNRTTGFFPSSTPSALDELSAMTSLPRNLGGFNVRPVDNIPLKSKERNSLSRSRQKDINGYSPPIEAYTEKSYLNDPHSNKISLEGQDDPQPPNFDAEEAIPSLVDSKGGVHFNDGPGGAYGLSGEIPGLLSPGIESVLTDKNIDSSSGYIFVKPITSRDGDKIESLTRMLSRAKEAYSALDRTSKHKHNVYPTRLPILNNPFVPAMEMYTPSDKTRVNRPSSSEGNTSRATSARKATENNKKRNQTNAAYIPVIDPFIFRNTSHQRWNNKNHEVPAPLPFLQRDKNRTHNREDVIRTIVEPIKYPSRPPPDHRHSKSIHDERTAPDQVPSEIFDVKEVDHLRSQASFAMQPPMLYVAPKDMSYKKELYYNDTFGYLNSLIRDQKSVLSITTTSPSIKLIPGRASSTDSRLPRMRVIPRNNAKSNSFIDAPPDIFFDDDPSLGSFEVRDRSRTRDSIRKTPYAMTPSSSDFQEDHPIPSTTPATNGHAIVHEEDDRDKYDVDDNYRDAREERYQDKKKPETSRPVYETSVRDEWTPVTPSTTSVTSPSFREYAPFFEKHNKNDTDIVYEPRAKDKQEETRKPHKPKKNRLTPVPNPNTSTTSSTTTSTTTSTTPRPITTSRYSTSTTANIVNTTITTTIAPKKKTTMSVVRQMSAKKSRPTNKRLIVKFKTTVAPKPPSRPKAIHATPTPLSIAEKCDAKLCKLPDCNCGSSAIPGGLKPKQVPQIVMITFDDAINDLNWEIYEEIFNNGKKNPNGCPPLGTFYVSHEWTDYGQVQTLYSRGHEMASHGVTHSFGEKFSKGQWMKEMQGQREILHLYGGVKLEDIRGMRAPFLQVTFFQKSFCNHFHLLTLSSHSRSTGWRQQNV